ncbi:MAG: type II secretion system protein [Methylococcales bacterium]|nr:type II secretion system protein [Methylococcales bacterium]
MTRQQGYSLIELSVTLVALGVFVAGISYVVPQLTQRFTQKASVVSFQQLDEIILGFVYANGRLPCPAKSVGSGVEDCALTEGFLPYLDLRMTAQPLNPQGIAVRYGVYRVSDAASGMRDADLATLKERYQHFRVELDNNAPQGALRTAEPAQANSLDFCQAISAAYQDQIESRLFDAVEVRDNAQREHIAYVIADAGLTDKDQASPSSLYDGRNREGKVFEQPTRAVSEAYDDLVHVVYFNELWDKLGCTEFLALVGHAHPHLGSTAAIMWQAMKDQRTVLETTAEFLLIEERSAGAKMATIISEMMGAAATIPISGAEIIITAGTNPLAAWAIGATGVAIAAYAVFIAKQAIEIDNIRNFKTTMRHYAGVANKDGLGDAEKITTYINQIEQLHNAIKTNIIAADHAGVFEK